MSYKKLTEKPKIDPSAKIIHSSLGKWTEIGARTSITETVVGDYSYVVNDCNLIYCHMGKFCSIASHVRINPGNHPLNRAALHHFTYRSRQFELGEDDEEFFNWRRSHKVTMGHDVWIGHGVIVLPGVSIGTGAAIGAGAVVTKDVAPFSVVVGVPAKPIRERFPQKIQDALMRICWWDWSHDKLKVTLTDFRGIDAADFVKKHDPT